MTGPGLQGTIRARLLGLSAQESCRLVGNIEPWNTMAIPVAEEEVIDTARQHERSDVLREERM